MSIKVLDGYKVLPSCRGGVGSIGCNRTLDDPYSGNSGGLGGLLDDPLGAHPAPLGQCIHLTVDLDAFKSKITGGESTGAGTDWHDEAVPCGGVVGWVSCADGHKKAMKYHCDRQVCPVCAPRWIAREANRIGERFSFVRATRPELQHWHIVVSYRDLPDSLSDYRKRSRDVYKLMKKLGVVGGCLVPHEGIRKGGKREIHFHIDGVSEYGLTGAVKKKVVANFKETDIVTKFVRKVHDDKKLSGYELDHAMQVVNPATGRALQTVRWFGIMSTRQIGVIKTTVSEPVYCDHKDKDGNVCGKPMYQERVVWKWDNYEMYPVENPPFTRLIEKRDYYWRKKPKRWRE